MTVLRNKSKHQYLVLSFFGGVLPAPLNFFYIKLSVPRTAKFSKSPVQSMFQGNIVGIKFPANGVVKENSEDRVHSDRECVEIARKGVNSSLGRDTDRSN